MRRTELFFVVLTPAAFWAFMAVLLWVAGVA